MRSKIYKIYGLIDPKTRNLRYVGVTSLEMSTRIKRHLRRLDLKLSDKIEKDLTYKERWLNKFVSSFEVNEVPYIILHKFDVQSEAYNKEKEMIEEFNDLTNIAEGGKTPPVLSGEDHPFYGKSKEEIFSEEVLEKMSQEMSGDSNPMSGTTILEKWINKYGKEEALQKFEEWKESVGESIRSSEKFQENRFSEEWRENMSKSRGMSVYLLDEDKNIVKEFQSCTKASDWLGCTRGNVKNARRENRMIYSQYYVVALEDFE